MAIRRDPSQLPRLPDLEPWPQIRRRKDSFKIKVDNAEKWFELEEVGKEIVAALRLTRTWLIANEQQMGNDLAPDPQRPWFDNSRRKPTADSALLDIQRSLLRQQIYAHGLLNLLVGLESAGVIHPQLKWKPTPLAEQGEEIGSDVADHFFNATNLASAMIHLNMIGWDLIGRNTPFLNMTKLLPAYLYEDQKGDSRKIRDNHVAPMTAMGLWTAKRRGNEWRLFSGKVGRLFHRHVYLPVAMNYDKIACSQEPQMRGLAPGFALPEITDDSYKEQLPDPFTPAVYAS